MGQLEADSYTADQWFLSRGLPAVVHRSSLLRRLWSRSAPALAGLALIAANSVAVVAISGEHTIDIAGRPDLRQSLVLGLLAVALPLAALAGWLVSRIESRAAGRWQPPRHWRSSSSAACWVDRASDLWSIW